MTRPRIVQIELEDLPDTHMATEKYIKSLEDALMRVQNFPSHPGGHQDDRSRDADCPESWRHGWICAVEAMQDHALPNAVGNATDGIAAGITDWLDAQGTDEAHRARDLIARQQAKIDRLRKSLRDALEVVSHLMNPNLYNTARELADEPYCIAGAPDAYFEAAEKIAAEQREYRSTEKK